MQKMEIKVKGQIDSGWSQWFDGLAIQVSDRDETIISGEVRDQAALYGLIARLRDLGLRLVSVQIEAADDVEASDEQ
jgi:hypothetical protein